ncbi:DUF1376 domain-containing protein [Methylobacterium brachythecii]|nr:DUF1376 domain-containing protein [Methylobacterium brachythecii]MBB3905102.1 hypothetical protein [Methylobacterium brachythecii]
MPLDVARLRDSAIVDEISGDEFRAAILLWCASWHQVPAGSLPNDPKQLSKFAGYGRVIAEWEKVAGGALYGWIECSDGRLYHPVIAEKALEAWEKKSEFSQRSNARAEQARAAAEARWGKGQGGDEAAASDAKPLGTKALETKNAEPMREQCGSMPGALPKGNRQGQGIETAAARSAGRSGSDELGARLRPLVGSLPVSVDPDLTPIRKLLAEGLELDDVEQGIRAFVERGRTRPRAWGDFEKWIRRAAKDRLDVDGSPPAPTIGGKPRPLPSPAQIRRVQIRFAAEHFRGHFSDGWPNEMRPGHPDCTIPEEVIDEARLLVATQQGVSLAEFSATAH